MGSADFYNRGERFGFGIERVTQGLYGRNQQAVDLNGGGNMNRRRETIVGRLGVVDVVVGVDEKSHNRFTCN